MSRGPRGRGSPSLASQLELILRSQPRCPPAAQEAHERRAARGRWSSGRAALPHYGRSASAEEFWAEVLAADVRGAKSPPSSPTPANLAPKPEPEGPSALSPRSRGGIARMEELRAYDCCVCLAPMTRSSVAVLVPCFHRFCYRCILQWLRRQGTCALCKTPATQLCYSIRNATNFKVKRVCSEHDAVRLTRAKRAGPPAGARDAACATPGFRRCTVPRPSRRASKPTAAADTGLAASCSPAPAPAPSRARSASAVAPPRPVSCTSASATPGAPAAHAALAYPWRRGCLPLSPHPDAVLTEGGELSMSVEASNALRASLGLPALRKPPSPPPHNAGSPRPEHNTRRRSPRLRMRDAADAAVAPERKRARLPASPGAS